MEEKKEPRGHWGVSYPIDDFYEEVKKAAASQNMDVKTFVRKSVLEKIRSIKEKHLNRKNRIN